MCSESLDFCSGGRSHGFVSWVLGLLVEWVPDVSGRGYTRYVPGVLSGLVPGDGDDRSLGR